MEDSNVSTKIIILDACRNNPLPDTLRGMLNGGLAPVYAPTGTIIAFSTSPGQTAMDDGPGGNSIYTHSLISHIADQNIPIETFFKRVRTTVHSLSDGLQTSWEHTCLIGNFCFNEGSLTHAVKMPYPQEYLGDKNFVPDGSILSDLIVKMKLHDWYIQKSAIETFKHTKIDSPPHELLFLMGRNILQSAIGTEKVATKFMNSLSYWLPNFQTEATNHVLNGMLFEMYFDKNGRIRSNGSFKSEFIDLIYQLETIEEFSSCFQLIKDQILPFRQIVFYLPGDASVPIDVRLDKFDYLDFQKQEQVKYQLASVKYEGLELKSADPTDRMFFTELSYDELRLKVSRCLMIPLEKLTMTTNFTGSEARFISIPWDLKLSSPKGIQ